MNRSNVKSIRGKLMRIIMVVCGIVVLATCAAFFLYEYYSFRISTRQKLETFGQIIATNSTAALAFQSREDAVEVLSALNAEPHIIAAAIYDADGNLFCSYLPGKDSVELPAVPGAEGYQFNDASLEGFQSIAQGGKRLGTLYLQSDLEAMYNRLGSYGLIVFIILGFAFLLSFLLSKFLHKSISNPILALAETAKAVSLRKDYSVRARRSADDEVGLLTDAFNQMLEQIEDQTARLNSFNQNLEQMVSNRTEELEAANKELESFSYTVSHDLRTPVRAIDCYIQIFMEDYSARLDDEGRRLLNIVVKNGNKMGMLIDDLLAFSQLGRKDLSKTNLPMHELVTEIWDELQPEEESRNIQLKLDEIPDAYAEQSTMRQVWTNLISNALKYTRNRQESVIEISAKQSESQIIYCIRDNGSGFDMQYYGKLFDVFQRLHSTDEYEGTGVGLAIVARIIEKHGGKIWAEATPDEGATFYFSLPVR